MEGLFKAKVSNIFLLAITLIFCVNMGTGKYAENVRGQEVPPDLVLKKGDVPFSGTVIIEGKTNNAIEIGIFDPLSGESKQEGKDVAVTHIEVLTKDSRIISKISLHNIREIKIGTGESKFFVRDAKEQFRDSKIFLVLQITNTEGEILERLIDPDASIHFKNTTTKETTRAYLKDVDSIKISHPEITEERSGAAKQTKEEKGYFESLF